jgi:hypothetical protein
MTPKHPFIDPEDTDWGREVQQRHEENQQRFVRIESLINNLWLKIDEADRKRELAREETKEKMAFLSDIHTDLKTAIGLFRGAKITARFVAWAAGLGSGAVVIWQFFWPKK